MDENTNPSHHASTLRLSGYLAGSQPAATERLLGLITIILATFSLNKYER